jgi:hypothetical protein
VAYVSLLFYFLCQLNLLSLLTKSRRLSAAALGKSIPTLSLIMIAAIYGLQALVLIMRPKWDMIGWMIFYIPAIPAFSFILPLYSFLLPGREINLLTRSALSATVLMAMSAPTLSWIPKTAWTSMPNITISVFSQTTRVQIDILNGWSRCDTKPVLWKCAGFVQVQCGQGYHEAA